MNKPRLNRPGLVLHEAAIGISLVGLLLVCFAVSATAARVVGQRQTDVLNLGYRGALAAAYGADKRGQMPSFTWSVGNTPSDYPDLQNAFSDRQARANQFVDIMRRRSFLGESLMAISGWVPDLNFSHIPLMDHAGLDIPDERFVPLGSGPWATVAREPVSFFENETWPTPFGASWTSSNSNKRYMAATWFRRPMATLPFVESGNDAPVVAATSDFVSIGTASEAPPRRFDEIAFASRKVYVAGEFDYYSDPSRQVFHLHDFARTPYLMGDGSAQVRRASEANMSADPRRSNDTRGVRFRYQPQFELALPPTVSGSSSEVFDARMLYTRGGLSGIDFDGPDIDTGQPLP